MSSRPAPGEESARYARLAHLQRSDGPAARPGPAVLLLHGLGGQASQPWDYLDGPAEWPRLAPDLRAHGRTRYIGPASAFSFDGLADDVVAVLDLLGLTRPVLVVGVSMGAGVALNLATRWPGRLAGLVLVRPAWLDEPMPPHLAAYPLIAALLRAYGAEQGLARFERSAVHRQVLGESPAAAASLRAQFTADCAAQRAVRLEKMPCSVPYPDIRALRRVRLPALVLGAPRDPAHPIAVAEATAAALPGASLVRLAGRDEDAAAQLAQVRRETTRFLLQVAGPAGSRPC
jgi:pimeloyl-ACP methyl ester carboxylesterase